MTLENVLDITFILLLCTTIYSVMVFLSSYAIWNKMKATHANVVRLAPRLDDPEFRDERINMDESITNLAIWVKDIRFVLLLHVVLIGASVYNLMYEEYVNPVIAAVIVGTQIYLTILNYGFRKKLGAAVGLNAAMMSLLLASDLLKTFEEYDPTVSVHVERVPKKED